MMLRIAVCDDMTDFLQVAKRYLEEWSNSPARLVVELFSDGESLIERHQAAPFDMIFLDVIMPMQSGIETAAEIRRYDQSVKIILLTSSPEFVEESYEVHANHYLLKPLTPERLYHCICNLYDEILEQAKFLTIPTITATHRVALRRIESVEALGKKVSVTLEDGHHIESNQPLYFFQSKLLLADGFFKCHRSSIVNLYRIATYTQKEIQMQSGARIPISRSCHGEFEAAYFDLLFREGEST